MRIEKIYKITRSFKCMNTENTFYNKRRNISHYFATYLTLITRNGHSKLYEIDS